MSVYLCIISYVVFWWRTFVGVDCPNPGFILGLGYCERLSTGLSGSSVPLWLAQYRAFWTLCGWLSTRLSGFSFSL